jgi:phosphatidate cytidylyltransferase
VLRTRILTALVFGGLLIGSGLWLPSPVFAGVCGATLLLSAYEWSAFVGLSGRGARLAYVAAIAAIGAVAALVMPDRAAWRIATALALGYWIAAALWVIFIPRRVSRTAAALAGFAVLVPPWLAMLRLLQLPGQPGRVLVLFALALVFSADVGAYFVGRRLGHRPLAPLVSPKKTWEGVAGGVLAGLLFASAGWLVLRYAPGPFLTLCVGAVLFSVVGDLTESMFKRYAGLKDSGQLLPGHGGMLDRIDGVTAALPLFAFGLDRLGVLP